MLLLYVLFIDVTYHVALNNVLKRMINENQTVIFSRRFRPFNIN